MRIYEPWIPGNGQRVKVHVSAECQVGHSGYSGLTGTVMERTWDPERFGDEEWSTGDPSVDGYRGHWYWVDFDAPVHENGAVIRADMFASVELEPA